MNVCKNGHNDAAVSMFYLCMSSVDKQVSENIFTCIKRNYYLSEVLEYL